MTSTAIDARPVPAIPTAPSAAQRLALGAIVGPVVFNLAWLLLGFVSPGYTLFGHRFTDYSPISQPISGLGMGSTAPYMNAAFVITGLMLIAGVIGVLQTTKAIDPKPGGRPTARRVTLFLLACTGMGQVVDGIFNLEAAMPHFIGFGLALGTPIISFLVAGRYFRGIPQWRRLGTWLLLGSPLTAILLTLFFMTFQPTADGAEHGVAGIVQRAGVIEMHVWFVAMGWLARRRP
jgi:hypothetical protein